MQIQTNENVLLKINELPISKEAVNHTDTVQIKQMHFMFLSFYIETTCLVFSLVQLIYTK